jgi:hypothetical protein
MCTSGSRDRPLPGKLSGRLEGSFWPNKADLPSIRSGPEFLFAKRCVSDFRRHQQSEDAFVAAMFHDSGLLPAFESPKGTFEVDGADTAERWVRDKGGSKAEASRVWYAVEMHTGDPVLALRQRPEAMLVYLGAGADVDGPNPGDIETRQGR